MASSTAASAGTARRSRVDQASSGQRILIDFDGVYMNSQVWINGTSLGTRPYGYTSFEYDLTPYVTFGGNNVIAVRVNNNQPNSRFYSGSGIYRNVWLTTLNPVHVPYDGVFVSTPSVSTGVGHGVGRQPTCRTSRLEQPPSVTVTATILAPSGAAATSGDSAAHQRRRGRDVDDHPDADRVVAAALVGRLAQPLSGAASTSRSAAPPSTPTWRRWDSGPWRSTRTAGSRSTDRT